MPAMTSSNYKTSTSSSGGAGISLRLLVWTAAVVAATAVAAATASPYDTSEGGLSAAPAKRQIPQPPAKPDRFTSVEQFDTYMRQLEAYLKLIGRQRFGKRSGGHSSRFNSRRRLVDEYRDSILGSSDSAWGALNSQHQRTAAAEYE